MKYQYSFWTKLRFGFRRFISKFTKRGRLTWTPVKGNHQFKRIQTVPPSPMDENGSPVRRVVPGEFKRTDREKNLESLRVLCSAGMGDYERLSRILYPEDGSSEHPLARLHQVLVKNSNLDRMVNRDKPTEGEKETIIAV